MTEKGELENLLERITSGDLEKQIAAIDKITGFMQELARQSVRGLAVSPEPMITAERLFMLGSIIVPALEDLVGKSDPGKTRTAASILLLALGSTKGLSDVIDKVRGGGPDAIIAARKMAAANVPDTGMMVIEQLRLITDSQIHDLAEAPYICSWLSVLKASDTPLPFDLKTRFSQEGASKQLALCMQDF